MAYKHWLIDYNLCTGNTNGHFSRPQFTFRCYVYYLGGDILFDAEFYPYITIFIPGLCSHYIVDHKHLFFNYSGKVERESLS